MKTIDFIKRLLREQPTKLILIVVTSVITGLLEGSSVALFVPLLQLINTQGSDQMQVGRLGLMTQQFLGFFGLGLTLVNVLILIFMAVLGLQVATLVQQGLLLHYQYLFEANLRKRLYEAIFAAEWPFFLKKKAGAITNALTAEVSRAGGAFNSLILLMIIGAVIIIYTALAITIAWKMALAAGFMGVLVVVALQGQIKRARSEGEEITDANANLQTEAIEQISGAKYVKGSAIEAETTNRFNEYVSALAKAQFRTYYNSVKLRVYNELLIIALLCVGIYVAVARMNMPIATLIVFMIIFYRLAPRLSNFQTIRRSLGATIPALAKIDDFISEAEAIKERGGNLPARFSQGLNFKDVNFSYIQGHPVLKGINLSVPKGKTVAIVGSSGAGKSTAVDLIMALISPDSGTVLIDGVPLGEFDYKSWRRLIGYVAQDTVLFHASVKANIIRANIEATDADIEAAARSAYAMEFIEQLPDGFDTIIGDRGVRLSGGQKQRLALAGALIRKPEILILDEATSALDAESELKIQKAVESLAQSSMTIVIITHRLATVKNADYIYVLEKGELIEEGNWATLTQSKGRFQTLKHLQALD